MDGSTDTRSTSCPCALSRLGVTDCRFLPRRRRYDRTVRAWLFVLAGCYASTEPPFKVGDRPRVPRTFDYPAICQSIADEIAAIRGTYPQLAGFEATATDCTITYAHHTHRATHVGGWTAGVPNPDPDGVWFYIGVWDPADPVQAMAQIKT